MKSNFLNINWKDAVKGFVVAVVSAILTMVYEAIENGGLAWTWTYWQPIVLAGILAGIAYLLKNFFTNSNDQLLKKEQ